MLKIKHPSHGMIFPSMNSYQLEVYDAFHAHKNIAAILPRQSGASTLIAYLAYLNRDINILILADCQDMVSEIKHKFFIMNDCKINSNITYRSILGKGIDSLNNPKEDLIIIDNYSWCRKLFKKHTDRLNEIANDENKKLLLITTTLNVSYNKDDNMKELSRMFVPDNTVIIR